MDLPWRARISAASASTSEVHPGIAAVITILQGDRNSTNPAEESFASRLDVPAPHTARLASVGDHREERLSRAGRPTGPPTQSATLLDGGLAAPAAPEHSSPSSVALPLRTFGTPSTSASRGVHQAIRCDQLEARIGDAICAELELESLQAKRRRLLQLSKDVLEARCHGFSKVALTDDEFLREAGHALANISADVDQAARMVRSSSASSTDLHSRAV